MKKSMKYTIFMTLGTVTLLNAYVAQAEEVSTKSETGVEITTLVDNSSEASTASSEVITAETPKSSDITRTEVIDKEGVVETEEKISDTITEETLKESAGGSVESVTSTPDHIYDPADVVRAQTMADITFIIDTTGSMDDHIGKVARNLSKFADYLEANNINYGISIVTFKDAVEDEHFVTVEKFGKADENRYWSYDKDEIKDKLATLEVFGGGDIPETPTEGLNKVLDLQTTINGLNELNSLVADPSRKHAKKFAFLLTDVDYKEPATKMSEIASQFQKLGIRTTVISNPWTERQYRELYSWTEGEFIDINLEDYSRVMLDLARWVGDRIEYGTTGPLIARDVVSAKESSLKYTISCINLLDSKLIFTTTVGSEPDAASEITGYICVAYVGDRSGENSFVYYYVPEGTDLATVKKLLEDNNLEGYAVSGLDKLFPVKPDSDQARELNNQAKECKVSDSKATLPKTGNVTSFLPLFGLGGLAAVVIGRKQRKM
ncbi:TPA: VWA domain-containing protein [Streptococcus suis]